MVFGSPISVLVFSEVRVEGLETVDYVNNLQNRERFIEQGDALTFESEVSIDLRLLIFMFSKLVSTDWYFFLFLFLHNK